ncbi:MAG: ABC transporter ATP-binding protein [Planctomycetota bacterium]|jgi:ABC-2 type transport system ATP-binding protein
MIEIQNLSKNYGSCKALSDLSLSIDKGGVIAFLGPNGAGKSTFIRIITGAISFDSGTVKVCGCDIVDDPHGVKQRVGYLPESNPLYDELRVSEFLYARAGIKGLSRSAAKLSVGESLELCQIGHVNNRIIGQLSKGYRQRVGLADSLLGDPELLILDEPMVGLDPNQLRDIKKMLVDIGRKKTVFLSTHVLHDVEELAREVVIINDGKLVTVDSPEGLIAKSSLQRKIVLETNENDDIGHSIKELGCVGKINIVNAGSSGISRFVLETSDVDNCRKGIISLFSTKGWFFQEMRVEPIRLGDIFSEVTSSVTQDGQLNA